LQKGRGKALRIFDRGQNGGWTSQVGLLSFTRKKVNERDERYTYRERGRERERKGKWVQRLIPLSNVCSSNS